MNKAELALTDKYLKHQVDLLRFTAGEQNKTLALLKQMQVELKAKLRSGLTDFSKARINKVLKEATGVIDDYYKAIAPGKAIDPLMVEARKYKSAEEFITGVSRGVRPIREAKVGELVTIRSETYGIKSATQFTGSPSDGTIFKINPKSVSVKRASGEIVKLPASARVSAIDLKQLEGMDRAAIADVWKKAQTQSTDMLALAQNEAKFTANTFAGIGLDASLPSEVALKALVNGSLIEGAQSFAWWARQAEDLQFKFANQVRQGIIQNETLQQIIRRVAGSKRLGIPGIMDVSRRNASALVHTSIMQVANDARLATFKANDDIIKGTRFLATLDSHTSLTCIAHSGAEWDMEGKPIVGNFPFEPPPLHFNCRSMLVPITLSYRELGIDVDKPKGTRASDLGQIPSDTTFSSFLKRHDAAYVDDLLGPGRAKLWRDGKITLNDLVSQTGRPLTLDQLAKKSN